MTCIVGIETDSGIILGGDSASASSSQTVKTKTKKVFRYSESMGIGYTTSFRMGQLLQNADFHPPEDAGEEWVIGEFIPKIRQIFDDGGFIKKKSERERGGLFLLALHGDLYKIQGDFSTLRPHKEYEAVGSGFQLAKGSLFSTTGDSPEERVRTALRAAAETGPKVSSPFNIVRLES